MDLNLHDAFFNNLIQILLLSFRQGNYYDESVIY